MAIPASVLNAVHGFISQALECLSAAAGGSEFASMAATLESIRTEVEDRLKATPSMAEVLAIGAMPADAFQVEDLPIVAVLPSRPETLESVAWFGTATPSQKALLRKDMRHHVANGITAWEYVRDLGDHATAAAYLEDAGIARAKRKPAAFEQAELPIVPVLPSLPEPIATATELTDREVLLAKLKELGGNVGFAKRWSVEAIKRNIERLKATPKVMPAAAQQTTPKPKPAAVKVCFVEDGKGGHRKATKEEVLAYLATL
jgi:hypothetical protein